jgi:hypothetical protein
MIFLKHIFFFSLILPILLFWGTAVAQDYEFDIPEEEETAIIEFSGNLDAIWGILQTNESSPFYGLQFFEQEKPAEFLSQYRLDFYFNGDYRYKQVGFTMRTFTQYTREEPIDLFLFELFGSLNLSPRLTLGIGKRRYNWGKGYAFNPVGYVNPEKDPENPDLAMTGKSSVFIKYNRSFTSGWIQNLSLSTIILPPEANILYKYADPENTSLAVKLYLLFQNIDLDIMAFTGKNQPHRLGMDFSTNLRENFEVHGEISYAKNDFTPVIENSLIRPSRRDGFSYLFGIRYLNSLNITFIAEYYHNNSGLTHSEYIDYLDLLRNNLNSSDPELISYSKSVLTTSLRTKNFMQDYVYFKASLPEPFEWLYSFVSIFTIYNINDNSFILSPQIGYRPFTNSEILFWPSLFLGDSNSEYGSKQFQNKVEMWFRFYF